MNVVNTVLILCILLVVSLIVVVIVFRGKRRHTDDYPSVTTNRKVGDNYITPAEFNVGLIKNKPYKAANLCDDKALYPMRNLDVEYGLPPIPNDCPCAQFVQPP